MYAEISMSKRVKHSVAAAIINGNRILSTRRPDNDNELPGIWGLPAGTCRNGESAQDVIRRIGSDKLKVNLVPIRKLNHGVQDRPEYLLEMELWETSMEGEPSGVEWQWVPHEQLHAGAVAGSLCCELGLNAKSRISS